MDDGKHSNSISNRGVPIDSTARGRYQLLLTLAEGRIPAQTVAV